MSLQDSLSNSLHPPSSGTYHVNMTIKWIVHINSNCSHDLVPICHIMCSILHPTRRFMHPLIAPRWYIHLCRDIKLQNWIQTNLYMTLVSSCAYWLSASVALNSRSNSSLFLIIWADSWIRLVNNAWRSWYWGSSRPSDLEARSSIETSCILSLRSHSICPRTVCATEGKIQQSQMDVAL